MSRRIQMKIENGKKTKNYGKKLLQDFKTQSGPFTSAWSRLCFIQNHTWLLENIQKKNYLFSKLKWLIIAHTSKTEKFSRSELFRLTAITHDEELKNLLILLEGEDASSSLTVTNLPTNAEAVAAMPENMAREAVDKLNDRT